MRIACYVIQFALFIFATTSCGKRFVVVESNGIGQARPVLLPTEAPEVIVKPVSSDSASTAQKAPITKTQQTVFQEANFFKKGTKVTGSVSIEKLQQCSWQFQEARDVINKQAPKASFKLAVKRTDEGQFDINLNAQDEGVYEIEFACTAKCSCAENAICKSCNIATKSISVAVLSAAKAEDVCVVKAEGPCEAAHKAFVIGAKNVCSEVTVSGCSLQANCRTQSSCQRGLEFLGSF